jgi:hypothetical protein
MGNCSFKHDDEVTPTIGGYPSKLNLLIEILTHNRVVNISKYNFTFQYVIGRGGFGQVSRYYVLL